MAHDIKYKNDKSNNKIDSKINVLPGCSSRAYKKKRLDSNARFGLP